MIKSHLPSENYLGKLHISTAFEVIYAEQINTLFVLLIISTFINNSFLIREDNKKEKDLKEKTVILTLFAK